MIHQRFKPAESINMDQSDGSSERDHSPENSDGSNNNDTVTSEKSDDDYSHPIMSPSQSWNDDEECRNSDQEDENSSSNSQDECETEQVDQESSKRQRTEDEVPAAVDHSFVFNYPATDVPIVNDKEACAKLMWLIKPSNVAGSVDKMSSKRQRIEEEVPAAANTSFAFSYPTMDVPFADDKVACAELMRLIRGSNEEFPAVDDLAAADAYREMARSIFRFIGESNRIIGLYDQKLKTAEKSVADLNKMKELVVSTRALLEIEKGKVAVLENRKKELESQNKQLQVEKAQSSKTLNSEIEKLQGENTQLYETLKSEIDRLCKSREDWAKRERLKAQYEMVEKYKTKFEKIRRHLDEKKAADETFQMFSQISGLLDCLEGLANDGVAIPEETMAVVVEDKAIWKAKVDAMNITELVEDDLTITPAGENEKNGSNL